MREIVSMKKRGLDAMDLIALFVGRRVQPLQARVRKMWEYTGLEDPTRYSNKPMNQKEFDQLMKIITSVTHGAQMHGRVRPLDSNRSPVLVISFKLGWPLTWVKLCWILDFDCSGPSSDEHCSFAHTFGTATSC